MEEAQEEEPEKYDQYGDAQIVVDGSEIEFSAKQSDYGSFRVSDQQKILKQVEKELALFMKDNPNKKKMTDMQRKVH